MGCFKKTVGIEPQTLSIEQWEKGYIFIYPLITKPQKTLLREVII
jgi:hypothetical protein